MRVLIVEDEPNLGQQLKNTLEGAGYAIDLATDEIGRASCRERVLACV